ncbi:hypothetical protein O181_047579 [Austropuccinia psidii MF-1]|uniref:Uncharacterized protein n=1 Tax=Austropuccinia psidii MF-1 TaxID=1389203 RepID=A0A9Q3HM72_9BASI|nr:hypothetical protein [Austropuccinia psidii MF-1]
MPFVDKVTSAFQVGAKTWRPKSANQQLLEAENKRLAEEESRKSAEVQQKIRNLEQIRKLEAKTQALNELSLAAEIEAKEHELSIRERQAFEAKQAELAKLELAKRMGRESLDEAELARIRRERMRTELVARAANNHAVLENSRPLSRANLREPTLTPLPPPPPNLEPLPPPPIPRVVPIPSPRLPQHIIPPISTSSIHRHPIPSPRIPQHGHSPIPPPLSHRQIPIPTPISTSRHLPDLIHHHSRFPSEPGMRMRRLSGSFVHQPDLNRAPWGSPENTFRNFGPSSSDPFDRNHNHTLPRKKNFLGKGEAIATEMALRAQAERLRRKRLEPLDLKARQLHLKAQVLRDLRKRELVAQLKERGLQQLEIESQVRLLAERDKLLNEAELRQLRDREHRLLLKEKGLQEREIMEQVRRREEKDREILRLELAKTERELRRKELLQAELEIKRTLERGESPPMGITRPSIEEIENEGLLNDLWDEFDDLDPRLRNEILSQTGLSSDQLSRTFHGLSNPSINSQVPNIDRFSSQQSINAHQTPHLRSKSPAPSMSVAQTSQLLREEQNRLRQENQLRQEILNAPSNRVPTPRCPERIPQVTPQPCNDTSYNNRLYPQSRTTSRATTPRIRGEEMLGDNLRPSEIGRTTTPRSRNEEMLGDNLVRTPSIGRSTTPRSRAQEILSEKLSPSPINNPTFTPHTRCENMLGDNLVQAINRPRSQSFNHRPNSSATINSHLREASRSRENLRAQVQQQDIDAKAREMQRIRENLRIREEFNRLNPDTSQTMTPASSYDRRTPNLMDNLEPLYSHSHNASNDLPIRSRSRPNSPNYDYDSTSRPLSRTTSRCDDYDSPQLAPLGLPSRPSSRNLTAEDIGLRLEPRDRDHERERLAETGAAVNDVLLAARLQSAAVNSEINGGRRSRTNSRLDPIDQDFLRNSRNQLVSEFSNSAMEAGRRSRTNSRVEPLNGQLLSPRDPMISDFGQNSPLLGRHSRTNSRGELLGSDLHRSASRNQLGAELSSINGRRSRASSLLQSNPTSPSSRTINETQSNTRSPFSNELGTSTGMNDQSIRSRGSRPSSRLGNLSNHFHEHDYTKLTNEELAQLSTEQLEMLLAAESPSRSNLRDDGSFNLNTLSKDDIARMSSADIDALLDSHEATNLTDSIGQMGLGLSNLNRRPSHQGLDQSPPFGGQSRYLSSNNRGTHEILRSASRVGTSSSRQYNTNSNDFRNENREEQSPYNPSSPSDLNRSLYRMPGQYDLSEDERENYGNRRDEGFFDYHPQADLNEGEFIITEMHEQPGARLIERLGNVKASSNSTGTPNGGLGDRFEMHKAVKQLITEASRRGANGVISLRVSDMPDGSYVATGEAVVLGQ